MITMEEIDAYAAKIAVALMAADPTVTAEKVYERVLPTNLNELELAAIQVAFLRRTNAFLQRIAGQTPCLH